NSTSATTRHCRRCWAIATSSSRFSLISSRTQPKQPRIRAARSFSAPLIGTGFAWRSPEARLGSNCHWWWVFRTTALAYRTTSGHAATLWRWVADGDGDLVITDVVMPDENGLDLIPRIRKVRPELRIIVMSAQNTLLTAVKANERGAFEYLPKPFDLKELINVVERALTAPQEAAAPYAEEETEDQLPLIGRSPAMQEIYRIIARLMGTDLTVMIMGESGTGKELVARALHNYGKRRSGPFVAINMAAIPRELIESELFGHEKGAFTGATSLGVGRFVQAQGGTVFLDEIG